jgi:hypothetical protein
MNTITHITIDDANFFAGAYLNRGESQVRQRMACLPDFPKAIRLLSTGTARGIWTLQGQGDNRLTAKYQDLN